MRRYELAIIQEARDNVLSFTNGPRGVTVTGDGGVAPPTPETTSGAALIAMPSAAAGSSGLFVMVCTWTCTELFVCVYFLFKLFSTIRLF